MRILINKGKIQVLPDDGSSDIAILGPDPTMKLLTNSIAIKAPMDLEYPADGMTLLRYMLATQQPVILSDEFA